MSKQSPKYVLKAQFCKMKADYLRNIFECCHGDNGIFYNDPRAPKEGGYREYLENRKSEEINVCMIQ